MSLWTTGRLYILHSFLSRLYFFLPILVLWFQSQGFSQFQVTILLSVFFLSTTLAEIPTGLFSDRYGHHRAMALCGLCQAAGVVVLAYASHWGLAILGEFLMGVGQAFYTGSKEAYLFNYLEEDRSNHLYQRDYARAKFFEFIGMALGSLIGGSVYVHFPRLPFYLSAAAFLSAMGIAFFLHRTPQQLPNALRWGEVLRGLREIRQGPAPLKGLIAYYVCVFTLILIFIVTLVQPYLKEAQLPLSLFGILFFFFQSFSMLGSLTARRLARATGPFFAGISLLLCLSFVTLALLKNPMSLPFIGAVYFLWGLFLPTTSQAVNDLIRSEVRATILSTQDFLQSLSFVLLAPLTGLLTDHGGLSPTLVVLAALALLSVFFCRKRS